MARRSSPPQPPSRPQPVTPLPPPAVQSAFGKTLVNALFPAYVMMIAAGYGVLMSGFATTRGNEIGSDRCLFHALNAATLTGFQATIGVHEFNGLGQATSLLLMAGGAPFSLVVGGLAMTRVLRLPFSDLRVIGASFAALVIAAILGTAGGAMAGLGGFDSLFLAVSAFGNAGLVANVSPGATNAVTHLLLLPLAVVGGLGITVLMELAGCVRRRTPLSKHAMTTILGVAALYIVGLILLTAMRLPASTLDAAGWRELLAANSAMAVNVRTLGLPLEYATTLSRSVVWVLMGLMAIGAGSGGTAGGLKVTTITELVRGVPRTLNGQAPSRSFGIAIVWVGLYVAIVGVTQLMLLHQVSEMPADRLLFLSVSAVSNVGLSHDPLSITLEGLYTLSAAMFAGRVVPLLVLWWMADTTTDAELAVG